MATGDLIALFFSAERNIDLVEYNIKNDNLADVRDFVFWQIEVFAI